MYRSFRNPVSGCLVWMMKKVVSRPESARLPKQAGCKARIMKEHGLHAACLSEGGKAAFIRCVHLTRYSVGVKRKSIVLVRRQVGLFAPWQQPSETLREIRTPLHLATRFMIAMKRHDVMEPSDMWQYAKVCNRKGCEQSTAGNGTLRAVLYHNSMSGSSLEPLFDFVWDHEMKPHRGD